MEDELKGKKLSEINLWVELKLSCRQRAKITINVPLFKKLRDIIFLGGEGGQPDSRTSG